MRPRVSLGMVSLVVRRGNCTCPGITVVDESEWKKEGSRKSLRGLVSISKGGSSEEILHINQ